MWRKGKGFTLIELMVVIAIILILALIAIPAYRNMQIRAKRSRAMTDLKTIATALEAFYTDWGKYPKQEAGVMDNAIVAELSGGKDGSGASINVSSAYTATGELGPVVYLENVGKMFDPFNPTKRYFYECGADSGPYYIWSVGPNGTSDAHAVDSDDIVRTNE